MIRFLGRILCGLVVTVMLAGCGGNSAMDEEYQKQADEQRIKHFYEIADLVEEYKDKVGHYPLATQKEMLKNADGAFDDDDSKKIYEMNPEVECLITPREIPERIKNRPGTFLRVSYDKMNSELSKGLGREVTLPYDPQEKPVYKPNFYVYVFRGGDYYLSVHLYDEYKHAQKVSDHFYKLQVTSVVDQKHGIVNYRQMRDKEKAASKE
ncbi:hypothetical protein BVX97_05505 [bacterium E08(2017)]|nr:hypothetical protein BVX97_05505 [bacterium E08(2017)]